MEVLDLRLSSMEVSDYRCFGHVKIDFAPPQEGGGGSLTVLVAKNGEGKTALLDAINVGLGTFVGKMPDSRGAGFHRGDIRTTVNSEGQTIETGRPRVTMRLEQSGRAMEVERFLTGSEKKSKTTSAQARDLTDFAIETLKKSNEATLETVLPILAYYGDSRLWADNVQTRGHIQAMLSKARKFAYSDSMNPKSGYKEFFTWFTHLLLSWHQQRLESGIKQTPGETRVERFVNTISSAVKTALAPSGWNVLHFEITDLKIYAERWGADGKVDCRVPVEQLSAGTKAVLLVVADLAYRCCLLNPFPCQDSAAITPGIVLIDEVELHLHPAWQQQILPALRKVFPRIQFIVTTHSPQTLSSVPDASVRIVGDGMVGRTGIKTDGARAEQLLQDIFGVSPRFGDSEVAQRLREYERLLGEGQWDSPRGRELWKDLKERLATDPVLGALEMRAHLKRHQRNGFHASH